MGAFAVEEALTQLSVASTRLHPDDIGPTVRRLARGAGLHDLVVYLADLEQRQLVPLPCGNDDALLRAQGIDGTVAGRAFRTQRVVIVPGGEEATEPGRTGIWFPLLDSAERFGVIHATAEEATVDDEHLTRWAAYVGLAGELLANKREYGDIITTTRRVREVSLAAEMRWSMAGRRHLAAALLDRPGAGRSVDPRIRSPPDRARRGGQRGQGSRRRSASWWPGTAGRR